jgi:hypothetical protein
MSIESAVKGLEKYEQYGLGACPDSELRAAAATSYAEGQGCFLSFDGLVKHWIQLEMPMPSLPRRSVLNFCRRVYSLRRKCKQGTLLPVIAMEIARTHDDWLTVDRALKAVELSLKAMASPLSAEDSDALRQDVEMRISEAGKPGPATVDEAGCEGKDGTATEVVMTGNVATSVAGKPKSKRRNGKAIRGPVLGRGDNLSITAVAEVETLLDTHRKRTAAKNLRYALAGHQKVVKLVVAKRLCEHASFDDIAKEYGLTRAEVEDILTRMRKWVYRFTAYFNEDWYWKETGEKYIIPEH